MHYNHVMLDYYKILEVDTEASKEVIEKAYKALSLKYHPDKQLTEAKDEATRKWLRIREAYEVLSDDQRRAAYDQVRKREVIEVFLNEGLLGLVKRYLK